MVVLPVLLKPTAMSFAYKISDPIRAGWIYETWHYKYCSAIDYCTTVNGLLPLKHK